MEGKGGASHLDDHYKTTLNAFKFKQNYKKRTDMVKDAMMTAPYGDRDAMVKAIVDAIKRAACSRSTISLYGESARPATSCRRRHQAKRTAPQMASAGYA
jgi:hypothetical protein